MRFEHDGFDRFAVLLTLHDSSDVDDDEFKICRQLVAVARQPRRRIAEFNEAALDDAGAFRAIDAFDAVVPAGKIMGPGRIFLHDVAH